MTLRDGRSTVELVLCRSCDAFVFPQTEICPHCEADVAAEAERYETAIAEARAARDHLVVVLARHGFDAAPHLGHLDARSS